MENNTLAFVKFCGKLDDSYPGCQRNFSFKVGENTQQFQINGRGHTIDYFASLHVGMSSSNASSCIILLVLATVNFLDMGCWSAPRLFKNLTETSELRCSRELQEQLGLDGRKVFAFENKFGWPLYVIENCNAVIQL